MKNIHEYRTKTTGVIKCLQQDLPGYGAIIKCLKQYPNPAIYV